MFRRIKNKPLRYFAIAFYFIILFFCALELNFLWLFGYSPSIKDIKTPSINIVSELYTADGKLIGKYYKENRTPVEYDSISPAVIDALVATEDVRFYQHSGIDVRSLISSMISTASWRQTGSQHNYPAACKEPLQYKKQKISGPDQIHSAGENSNF
jgi:penicillin-binding protein 1A